MNFTCVQSMSVGCQPGLSCALRINSREVKGSKLVEYKLKHSLARGSASDGMEQQET